MKPEFAEKLFVESLFQVSADKLKNISSKLKTERLTGDASTRRYYRIATDSCSYVVCLDNPTSEIEKNTFVEMQSIYEKEGVRCPKIFDMNLKKGYILEEDLGDITFLRNLSGCTVEDELNHYRKAVDLIIKVHSIDATAYTNKAFTTLAFDEEKLMYEVNFTIDHFLKDYLEVSCCESLDYVKSEFRKISCEIASQKMVVTHRDFHSRNIMIKERDYILIDFQDTRMGIPQYDLVSLLEDNYYSLNDNNKKELKEYYWKTFLEPKKIQTKEDFEKFYSLMKIQRTFKAIGSFAFIYKTRDDDRYLKYIGYAFENLRKELGELGMYQLSKILSEKYYEN